MARTRPGFDSCEANDVCCSGHCNLAHGTCCRTAGQPCNDGGAFPTPFGGGCPSFTCDPNRGSCFRVCMAAGETCAIGIPCCNGLTCNQPDLTCR